MNYTKKLITQTLYLLVLVLFTSVVVKAQVFVKFDAQGVNNGTSWADAYTNLDTAINKTASGEIWVSAGTYKPSVNFPYYSYPTFNITKNIALYGGFKGNETGLNQRNIENNPTILSGDVGVAGNDLDNTPKVLAITGSNVDSTCIVDGFTITKAYYTNAAGSYQNAAVYIFTDIYNNRNPVVQNCIIKENFGFDGAGIYVRSAKPLINNNLITNNTAYQGAGIYLDYAGNARVIGNRITSNKCAGGYSHLSGGGIQIEAYCAPYIYGNLIDNNQTGTYGGGISVESNYSAVISNNIISNNTSKDGGGIYVDNTTTHLINNLIIGNKATGGSGGGMYVNYSFASRSVNNTIVGNSSDNYGGAVYLVDGNMQFTNTIIYKNPTKYNKQFNSNNPNRTDWFPRIDYCDIEEGKQGITFSNPAKIDSVWRTGNISVYPDFIDTLSSNYRLRQSSGCINAGRPDTTGLWLPTMDVAGAKGIAANTVDIGCYEYDSLFISTDSLIVTPGTINVEGRSDSTFYLSIRSNTNWSIASTPDWLIMGDTSGNNSATIKATAKANPSLTVARTGKLIFLRPGIAPTVQVNISQTGAAYLATTPDTIYIGSHINDTATFNVFSNLSWYLTGYPNWLSFNKFYSTDSAAIAAKATAANVSGDKRIAAVIVYSSQYNVPAITKRVAIIQLPGFYTLCQNGSDSISAALNGTTYQWQVNKGTGFINITDTSFYNGTNSKWLKLVNIPSSFNGYKYRCLVGTLISDVYALKIQNTWTGSVSNRWEDLLNWSCSQLPDANTDVVVITGNIVVNADTVIRSLTISSGATVTVAGGVHFTVLR